MASTQAKEQQVMAFVKKCHDLINMRSQIPNFDEVADQYLGEGETVEDEIDAMLKNEKIYSPEQITSLRKLKMDISVVLDQLESVDAPPSPQKATSAIAQPTPTPTPAQLTPFSVQVVPPAPGTAIAALASQATHGPQQVANAATPAPVNVPRLDMNPPGSVQINQPQYAPSSSQFPAISQQPTNVASSSLKHKNGREIWQAVKNDKQSANDLVFEALKSSGAIPPGFRASFLEKIIAATDDLYGFTNFLAPKVTPHCLSFKDAAYGSGVGKILHGAPEPRHLRILSVLGCCNMLPLTGNAGEVLDRIIRVCLTDGERIISNIYTIRISGTADPEKRSWLFNTAVSDTTLGWSFGELFIKCDSKSINVAVLFECSYIVRRSGTNEPCMVSCGWHSQPLVENNEPVRKGNFECFLNGGMPFESNVNLGYPQPQAQAQPQKQKKAGALKGTKEPYIMFKLADFNLERALVDTMPDTMVGSTLHLPAFDFYCDSLIGLLGKREHPQWAGRIANPFLSTFPFVADQPDIMDVIHLLWVEANKKLTRHERKDDAIVRTRFISTYLSLAIPALGSTVVGKRFDWLRTIAQSSESEARRLQLGSMLDALRQNKSPFLLPSISFRPVRPAEYVLDLMAPNSFTVVS